MKRLGHSTVFPFGKQKVGTSINHTGGGTIHGKRVGGTPNSNAVRVRKGRR